jgi:hypothetical protein
VLGGGGRPLLVQPRPPPLSARGELAGICLGCIQIVTVLIIYRKTHHAYFLSIQYIGNRFGAYRSHPLTSGMPLCDVCHRERTLLHLGLKVTVTSKFLSAGRASFKARLCRTDVHTSLAVNPCGQRAKFLTGDLTLI